MRAITAAEQGFALCEVCGRLDKMAEHARCPRCNAPLHRRKPHSLERSWALLIAAYVLYLPANLLPIMETRSLFGVQRDTIMSGVAFLWNSGSWMLALIVFVASVAVPLLKLLSLTALLLAVQRRSQGEPLQHARLYRLLELVGRWSMLDVYVVAILVALVQAQSLATMAPGPGVLAFGAVVVLSMLATMAFDPRLLWDIKTNSKSEKSVVSENEQPLSDNLPSGRIVRPRQRMTMIWIVPALAILVGIGLAVQAIRARGPEISLQFVAAEGLEANKTRVKFKDVEIGTVKSIALNPDRKSVRVSVQMDKQAEGLLVEDTRFWVVRPRVAAGGVSGLATLLSGAYIALDPGKSETSRQEFVGLEEPPLVTSNMPGRQFVLRADDLGSLDIGAPVYFRRIQVGRVVGYGMQKDGSGVSVRIFVDAPYDAFVTQASRFWHASGIDVSLNADGVKLDMQSLVSLALGGIAFSSPNGSDEEPVQKAEADSSFVLHSDQAAANRIPETRVEKYVLTFRESLRGLAVGAPVDFRGLVAGEVSRIDLNFEKEKTDFTMLVEISLYPDRFAKRTRNQSGDEVSAKASRDILEKMVGKGFRAQLRTGNVLSGQRYIALDFFANAKAGKIDWSRRRPELPVQPGTLDSLQDQLLAIVESLRHTMQHVDQLVVRLDKEVAPELTATLKDARKTLDSAERMLGSADKALVSDAPLQLEMRDTLREVGKAATAVRNLADLLERQPEALLTGKKGNEYGS